MTAGRDLPLPANVAVFDLGYKSDLRKDGLSPLYAIVYAPVMGQRFIKLQPVQIRSGRQQHDGNTHSGCRGRCHWIDDFSRSFAAATTARDPARERHD